MTLMAEMIMDLLVPPIMTGLVVLGSRGIASSLQGGSISVKTRLRQRREWKYVLALLYAVMFGSSLFAHLHPA